MASENPLRVTEVSDFEFTDEQLEELRQATDATFEHVIEEVEETKKQSTGFKRAFRFVSYCKPMALVCETLRKHGYDVLDITSELIKGIRINGTNRITIFEHHIYTQTKTDEEPITFLFDQHRDNDNDILVHTLLYYSKCTFPKGGRLFYDLTPHEETPLTIFDPRECKCICLSGNVSHVMEPCEGVGKREVFVFQVPVRDYETAAENPADKPTDKTAENPAETQPSSE